MGQRLLQRPSYGCLYKGSASSARRRNRSPSAAHRTSLPSPAVTGRHGRGAYDAPSRRAASRSTARVECARKAAAPAAPATTASLAMNFNVSLRAHRALLLELRAPSWPRARGTQHPPAPHTRSVSVSALLRWRASGSAACGAGVHPGEDCTLSRPSHRLILRIVSQPPQQQSLPSPV